MKYAREIWGTRDTPLVTRELHASACILVIFRSSLKWETIRSVALSCGYFMHNANKTESLFSTSNFIVSENPLFNSGRRSRQQILNENPKPDVRQHGPEVRRAGDWVVEGGPVAFRDLVPGFSRQQIAWPSVSGSSNRELKSRFDPSACVESLIHFDLICFKLIGSLLSTWGALVPS